MAPSYYLNQCWNFIDSNPRNKLQWNLQRNSYVFIPENAFENVVCDISAISSRPQCVNLFNYLYHPGIALLAMCAWNSPVTGEFPAQRPVARSLDIFFDLCLNKRLSKQSWGWWFETPSHPLWRHCNDPNSFFPRACGFWALTLSNDTFQELLFSTWADLHQVPTLHPHRHPVRRASWDGGWRTGNSFHRGRRGSRARDWN